MECVLTNLNLEAARDEIKATVAACDGTPTAKLVAVLIAAGITDTKEIAAILDVGERAVQKARKPNHSSPNSGTPNHSSRTTVRNEPQFANHSSAPNHSSPKTEPQFGRARVEDNNLTTNLETTVGSFKTPPTPSVAKPVDWRSAFGADDNHGVEFSQGRLTLVNGTRAFWVEQFGGDETALNLALIEAAGSIQRNSNAGLKAQVERKLANIARDTRERDKRYAQAVKSKAPAASQPGKGTVGISAARAVLEARKAREVHA